MGEGSGWIWWFALIAFIIIISYITISEIKEDARIRNYCKSLGFIGYNYVTPQAMSNFRSVYCYSYTWSSSQGYVQNKYFIQYEEVFDK